MHVRERHSWWRNPHCAPLTDPLQSGATRRQQHPSTQVAAAALAAVPLAGLMVWMYGLREAPPSLGFLLGGPLLGGGLLIVWVLLVHRFLGTDRLSTLGLRTDSVRLEIGLGLLGGLLLLVVHVAIGGLLQRIFPPRPAPPEIVELVYGLSRRPLLLALWLGPVVWIGVAGFEELWRVHLLRRLWRVWHGLTGRWVVIAVAAALVAGLHLYQPPAVMLSIGIISLLKGAFFLATGRFWTLVVAHAVYDSVQIAHTVLAIRGVGT